ncbi:DUF6440 family protein [Streptococcus tangpeifui]|uniref:DUF6440 family protein n=1 Tax=Streptococcus tangpeifui TaxID=2709400 RepID=UPI0013EE0528|nr:MULTISPECIES: DUF6440 family protein [unclassified Streptococcus]
MKSSKDKRFKKIFSERAAMNNITEIWIDCKTGVNYLWHSASSGGGLTPLLDKDGQPVVTPVEDGDSAY